ncbi:AraC family transcriptional regulator [Olsenella uli]|uniref:AraC family transcriptional regulator n=1 Tax=Olsenella uli TaxID=133926 RepID=UPI0012ABB39A|nr:helix-turn-helix domain-containing protein [Olsenella uli]
MSCVLLFAENPRELSLMQSTLAPSLEDKALVCVDSLERAYAKLKLVGADLLVADVPCFTYAYCTFLSKCLKLCPSMAVLVTSSASNKEVSSNVWRLGATDYLLKPYRPDWLVAAVHVILAKPGGDAQESRMDWRRERSVRWIGENLRAYKYKKCIQATREYVDSLYDSLDNAQEIADGMLAFAAGVVGLTGDYGPTCAFDAKTYLGRASFRFEQVQLGYRYDAYAVFERLVGRLFDLVEKEGLSGVSPMQRIVTKLDRSVHVDFTLVEAAEYASMSPSYFSKYFKRETGMSFVNYMTENKLEYAKLMLTESGVSIAVIARELSYNGANYFSKVFKKNVGITPSEYREQNGSHRRLSLD